MLTIPCIRTGIPLRPIPADDGNRWACVRPGHSTSEVEVLAPGISGAEGEEKGKGVIVRWGLEEAQSKQAGRRTGTR